MFQMARLEFADNGMYANEPESWLEWQQNQFSLYCANHQLVLPAEHDINDVEDVYVVYCVQSDVLHVFVNYRV